MSIFISFFSSRWRKFILKVNFRQFRQFKTPEVGIYKRKQENKNSTKKAIKKKRKKLFFSFSWSRRLSAYWLLLKSVFHYTYTCPTALRLKAWKRHNRIGLKGLIINLTPTIRLICVQKWSLYAKFEEKKYCAVSL